VDQTAKAADFENHQFKLSTHLVQTNQIYERGGELKTQAGVSSDDMSSDAGEAY